MTLCDVGNTNASFFENGKITKIKLENFKDFKSDEKIYFISVNDEMTSKLQNLPKFVNLEPTQKAVFLIRIAELFLKKETKQV